MEYALYRFLSFLLMESEHIPIRRHRLPDLEVCDITLDELEAIEQQGSDVGLDFQISEFCLTIAASFLAALLTVNIDSIKIFTVFVVIVVTGIIVGVAFLIKWYRYRKSFHNLVQKVRDRQVGTIGQEGKELTASDLNEVEAVKPETETEEDEK